MTTATTQWQWPNRTQTHIKRHVAAILWDLALNGDIIDSSGRSIDLLRRRVAAWPGSERLPTGGTSYLLREIEEGGRFGTCIARDITRGRCNAIRLLLSEDALPPCPWPEALEARKAETAAPGDEEPALDDENLATWFEPPAGEPAGAEQTIAAPTAIERLLLIQSLATDVLLDLAAMASQQRSGQDEEVLGRLATALEENSRLRGQLTDARETARARAAEAETLRKALRQTQANLDAFRQGAQVNDSGFKALRHMMTTRDPQRNGAS